MFGINGQEGGRATLRVQTDSTMRGEILRERRHRTSRVDRVIEMPQMFIFQRIMEVYSDLPD